MKSALYDFVMSVSNNFLTDVEILTPQVILKGQLAIPGDAEKIVLFVHGSGSGRLSQRNIYVASKLQSAGIATLLFDLLTPSEEAVDIHTSHLRFDINFLSERLFQATNWVRQFPITKNMKIGYFGASTGAAAALVVGGLLGNEISSIVSRGGRPDLADKALPRVLAPTLFIVGSLDERVIELNRESYKKLNCEKQLKIVPGASHLFEEPGKLELVAQYAADWFNQH